MPTVPAFLFREGTEEDLVRGRKSGIALALLFVVAQSPATASFHFMQVEKVIGGVCGDTSQQAIQLRMRSSFQNQVTAGRIRAWDAAGANPVVVIDFGADVAGTAAGSRVLSQSAAFEAAQNPNTDFTLTGLIPASYLPAGSLTFETDNGATVYWRLSWGGAGYTGSTTQSTTNGLANTAPVFPSPLLWWNDRAIVFPGASGATSTNNAADYIVSAATADFTNNTGGNASVVSSSCVFGDRFETAGTQAWTVGP
jgi:hypothetical protein